MPRFTPFHRCEPVRDRVHVMKSDRATVSIVFVATVSGCHALSGHPNSASRYRSAGSAIDLGERAPLAITCVNDA